MENAADEVVGFGGYWEPVQEVVWVAEVGGEGVILVVSDGPGIGADDEVDEDDTNGPDVVLPGRESAGMAQFLRKTFCTRVSPSSSHVLR